ncbi:gephyrin-like molybdotransferase receptor GlpR [Lentzea sp. DG1S-22]|uniref:divisome protein SepX/GlpR n=1 Tax=Lentzea sp. DG1S-22 TaxID=3108822 RepID=UPI002E77D4B9|nr:gephyrin-like molybdotransferase receptor GlpR [Lentzea sp. DG1S-22]WVH78270.1 gephyrin-like molybdotransferase receptor GlpR [Lentzea sp. DG1S-22]
MPSSLIIVALVVAWLVVLVPMMARKRQESARSVGEEYDAMPDAEYDDIHDIDDDYFDEEEYVERPFRRGRGGYDPETAALVAQAKYALRRRVVAFLLIAAVATGIAAGVFHAKIWYGHAALDVVLVGYLIYLRRQVRIEEEIRARRLARLQQVRRRRATGPQQQQQQAPIAVAATAGDVDGGAAVAEPAQAVAEAETTQVEVVEDKPALPPLPRYEHHVRPGTIPVDSDDEDPVFVELDGLESLRYRGAVGA